MDRELGAMHQRAKQAAADPRAFQRDSDAQWQHREDTCRDAECLRRWYAQRRQDLASASTAAPSRPRPATAPAPQGSVADTGRVALDSPPPAPRRPRPAPLPEPRYEAPPPSLEPGTASGAPTAEGSPGTP